jgi:predicted lipoprotein with Yx(FWY)xxD motif
VKAIHITVAVALAVALASLSAAVAGASAGSGGAGVGAAHTGLGRIAVDSHGRTLYLFEKDKRGHSACSGLCATYWPPLLTHGKPVAMAAVKRSLLGTIRRSDGRRQVTLAGHPLYRFSGDSRRGQTNGEGLNDFGGGWDALTPSGKKIEGGG